MSITQEIITILAVMIGTMCTRFLPFILFPSSKKPPEYITYLGKVLPYASLALLLVYCMKDAATDTFHGLPEGIAIVGIYILHKWKKSTLLSIVGGTILYMILVQTIF